jgi:hypothetical protein
MIAIRLWRGFHVPAADGVVSTVSAPHLLDVFVLNGDGLLLVHFVK